MNTINTLFLFHSIYKDWTTNNILMMEEYFEAEGRSTLNK